MLVLTFIFAVLNICLGFALAIYLGYGPLRAHQAMNHPAISHLQEKSDQTSTPMQSATNPTDFDGASAGKSDDINQNAEV